MASAPAGIPTLLATAALSGSLVRLCSRAVEFTVPCEPWNDFSSQAPPPREAQYKHRLELSASVARNPRPKKNVHTADRLGKQMKQRSHCVFPRYDLVVRDVISLDGFPDRFPDLRRALIGGACRFVAVGPPRAAPYKREASRGTGTNVHRALSAATNPNLRPINRGAEARGLASPRLCDRRPTTPTDHRRPDSDRRPSPCRPPHRPKVSPRNP
jgi:hypothetical protein